MRKGEGTSWEDEAYHNTSRTHRYRNQSMYHQISHTRTTKDAKEKNGGRDTYKSVIHPGTSSTLGYSASWYSNSSARISSYRCNVGATCARGVLSVSEVFGVEEVGVEGSSGLDAMYELAGGGGVGVRVTGVVLCDGADTEAVWEWV